MSCRGRRRIEGVPAHLALLTGVAFLGLSTLAGAASQDQDEEKTSRISDEKVVEIDTKSMPKRPKPIIELGNPFLGSGNIRRGWELPTGMIVQPELIAYGTIRSAVQAFHNGQDTLSEWANRADLFANLQLSGTERVLVGIRPLDRDGEFTSCFFNSGPGGPEDECDEEFNAEINTLFFEGDFGEIFPRLDPKDFWYLDWGFAVGRQRILQQEGLLINDDIDTVGVIRNTILPWGGTDLQFTGLYGWDEINRDDNLAAKHARLFGLFVQADYPKDTINADFIYVLDDQSAGNDGAFWAVSTARRIGHYNLSARFLGSHALDDATAAVSDGYLGFVETSTTPPWTHDLVYLTGFVGIDEFSSAARGPETGGPLGRTGVLFAAIGLGRYGAALGNRADESAGGAAGYQKFFGERRQVLFELGGRQNIEGPGQGTVAIGTLIQQAVGQHLVLRVDAFGALRDIGNSDLRDELWGGRFEVLTQF